MGKFVNQTQAIAVPQTPQGITDGNFTPRFAVTPSGPWSLVRNRFDQSMATAETMLAKLIGEDGNTGYLNDLQNIITDLSAANVGKIIYNDVFIGNDAVTTVPSAPVLSESIDTNFGSFSGVSPVLLQIPSVDLSGLMNADMPENISEAITWFEEAYNNELYTPLFTRLLADLQSGASGIGGTVEQEIYDRAQARQNIEEDKLQTEIEEYFSSTGFDLPTGAMASKLQEHANARALRSLDLNRQIMIEQAELAQKNNQFVVNAANQLLAVFRDHESKRNDRALDYAKAVAANAIAVYSEAIKGFIAKLEANKTYVQVQVENLRAIIEANRGAVEVYAAEAQVYETTIAATAKKNEAITDVYKTKVAGYDSETRAVSENQKNILQAYALKIQNADNKLKAAIASAETTISGYGTEYSLREKVAEAMANISMQAMASSYGAVNSSAGLSYSAGESVSESWSHSEHRGETWSHGESISAGVSLSNNLTESHGFEE